MSAAKMIAIRTKFFGLVGGGSAGENSGGVAGKDSGGVGRSVTGEDIQLICRKEKKIIAIHSKKERGEQTALRKEEVRGASEHVLVLRWE
jgi:hypothetical protein